MKRIKLLALVFVTWALILACNAFSGTSPSNGLPTVEPGATPTSFQLCAKNWQIKPLAVYQYPISNSTNLVIVDLGIKNDNKYWGKVATYKSGTNTDTLVVLIAADGSSYQPLDYNPEGAVYDLPSTPKSIYAGTQYNENSTWFNTNWIAPGGVNNGMVFEMPERLEYHYHFAFRVPASQNHFKLQMTNIEISCYGVPWVGGDGKTYTDLGVYGWLDTITYDLDKDVGPLKPSNASHPKLNGKLELDTNAVLTFENVYRNGGRINVDFSATGDMLFTPYVVGDDGLQRYPYCSSIQVCESQGIFPNDNWLTVQINGQQNQKLQGELTFTVPTDLKSPLFVVTTGGDSASSGNAQVYTINP